MKSKHLFVTVFLLLAYVLSACGAAGQPAGQQPADQAGTKVRAVEVAFTGVVESINGNQWTVNGQVVSVDPAAVNDGPFQVGDTVKIEGMVNPDGSLTVSRVEAPSASDLAELPPLGNENTNMNSNDSNSNESNSNTNENTNTDNDNGNANGNTNESSGDDQEIYGVVEVITEDSVTVDGITYNFSDFTEVYGTISIGDQVKIEFVVNEDGTLTVHKIEGEDSVDNGNSNSNSNTNDDDDDDNSNSNSNDDDDDHDDNSNNSNDDNDEDDDNSNSNNNSNDDD